LFRVSQTSSKILKQNETNIQRLNENQHSGASRYSACALMCLSLFPLVLVRVFSVGIIEILVGIDTLFPDWKSSDSSDHDSLLEISMIDRLDLQLSKPCKLFIMPDTLYGDRFYVHHM